MLNLKNLLAISLTTAMISPVFAATVEAPKTLQFTGTIAAPTCSIALDKTTETLEEVSTTSFKNGTEGDLVDLKIAGQGTKFKITVTDPTSSEKGAKCKSMATLAKADNMPIIKMNSSDVVGGFLKNTTQGAENSNLGLVIVDESNTKVDFSDSAAVRPLTDDDNGEMEFTAYYVAIDKMKNVEEQTLQASMTFSVDYK